jgi:hypothetical protein
LRIAQKAGADIEKLREPAARVRDSLTKFTQGKADKTDFELDKTVWEEKNLRLSEVQETNVYFRRNKKE